MDALASIIIMLFFLAWLGSFGYGMRGVFGSLIGLGLVLLIMGIVFLTNPILMSSGLYFLLAGIISLVIGLVSFRPVLRWEEKISKIKAHKETNKKGESEET